MVHQGPGGPWLKEGAGRRSGGRRSAAGGRQGGESWSIQAPRSQQQTQHALNRRRTIHIREAKSLRPSPIHTLITRQPHRADRGGRILARPLSVRRARAHGAEARPALPHVLEHSPPSCFPAANPRRCSRAARSLGHLPRGQLFAAGAEHSRRSRRKTGFS